MASKPSSVLTAAAKRRPKASGSSPAPRRASLPSRQTGLPSSGSPSMSPTPSDAECRSPGLPRRRLGLPPRGSPSASPTPSDISRKSGSAVVPSADTGPQRGDYPAAQSEASDLGVLAYMNKDTIKVIFDRFDLDGDGTLSLDELSSVMKAMAVRRPSDSAIRRLFKSMDVNEDDTVTLDEFSDWILDTGTASFKGVIELVATTEGARTLAWCIQDLQHPPADSDLEREANLVDGADLQTEIAQLDQEGLAAILCLCVVTEPVRRVMEAVYMLLLPSTGLSSIHNLSPPEWPELRSYLDESTTLSRIHNWRARQKELSSRPMWGAYAAKYFFIEQTPDPDLIALEGDPSQPLSYERVLSASQAQFESTDDSNPVVLLYRWIVGLLGPDLIELAKEPRQQSTGRGHGQAPNAKAEQLGDPV